MRILVTGASGRLGSAIAHAYRSRATVVAMSRAALDIADEAAVAAIVAAARPDAVINCAAFNDVDGAEQEVAAAIRVNALGVRTLARAAAGAGAIFVHYGTDFVFDGGAAQPYAEHDATGPQSVYACSKLMGEWFAAECPRHYVLRVASLFGGSGRPSTIDHIAGAIRRREPMGVFVDRTVTPSHVPDVVDATWTLVTGAAPAGVYHCVSTGVTTWFALAQELARQLGIEAELVPVKVADVVMKARRPQYAALSNDKLACAGVALPSWSEALRRYLSS